MQTRTVLVGVTRAGAVNAGKDWLGEREEQETKGTPQGGKKSFFLLCYSFTV